MSEHSAEDLEMILRESKDSRKEMHDHLKECRENVWKIITFFILLIGIYLPFMYFTYNAQINTPFIPLTFNFIYILTIIILSLFSVYPSVQLLPIDPDALYELLGEEKEEILDKLVQSYLITNKKYMIISEKLTFIRKIVISLIIGFVFQFLIVLTYILYGKEDVAIALSFILFVLVVSILVINYIGFKNKIKT